MRYFHVKSLSGSTMYMGIMHKDGTCFVFDKFDDYYQPLSVKQRHIMEFVLDKNCGDLEFCADSVEKYVDRFPEIGEYATEMCGIAQQHLYIQLLLARLPSAEYEMGLLLEIYNHISDEIYCVVSRENRFGSFLELENLGYVNKTSRAKSKNPFGYYFSLTDKGKALVDKHLHP